MTLLRRLATWIACATLLPAVTHAQLRKGPVESKIQQRLSVQHYGPAAFRDAVQLLDLIERSSKTLTNRETRARFALYRLRAIKATAATLARVPDRSIAKAWLDAHASDLFYYESADEWVLNDQTLQDTYRAFHDTASADDIAWFAAENRLTGECEGDVPCYVESRERTYGEYLRLQPRGRHVDAAVMRIAMFLNDIMDYLQGLPSILAEFDPKDRCGELHQHLDPLVAAIGASRARQPRAALDAAERYARLCR